MSTFTGALSFPAGVTETPVISVPNGVTGCEITFSSSGWPAGTYLVEVLLSQDGGVTFPLAASMTMPSPPITFRGASYRLQFNVDAAVTTHAKARVTAPSPFTSTVTIQPA